MPPKRPKLRELTHEEEKPLREAFLAGLKKRGWKKHEIDAAHGGWEYAFDTGFDQPESDEDAARDLAEGTIEDFTSTGYKKWGRSKSSAKEYCADIIFEGICAARKAQRDPEEEARERAEREARAAQLRAEIAKGKGL